MLHSFTPDCSTHSLLLRNLSVPTCALTELSVSCGGTPNSRHARRGAAEPGRAPSRSTAGGAGCPGCNSAARVSCSMLQRLLHGMRAGAPPRQGARPPGVALAVLATPAQLGPLALR